MVKYLANLYTLKTKEFDKNNRLWVLSIVVFIIILKDLKVEDQPGNEFTTFSRSASLEKPNVDQVSQSYLFEPRRWVKSLNPTVNANILFALVYT